MLYVCWIDWRYGNRNIILDENKDCLILGLTINTIYGIISNIK